MIKRSTIKRPERSKKVTIKGIITPAEWNENNIITAISISASDEMDYIVEENAIANELFGLMNEYVGVTGIAYENESGEKSILVKSYQFIAED